MDGASCSSAPPISCSGSRSLVASWPSKTRSPRRVRRKPIGSLMSQTPARGDAADVRLALNARNNRRNEPPRLAHHLNKGDDGAILIETGERSPHLAMDNELL